MHQTETVTDPAEWDRIVDAAGGHPLQLWGWGEVKASGPWRPVRLKVLGPDGEVAGGAQVLVRRLPAPFRALSSVPRGPFVAPDGGGSEGARTAVIDAVVAYCKREIGGVGVTIEPDWDESTPIAASGLQRASNTILYPSTLILDLTRSEDDLLAAAGKSTRYDIRKAGRSGLEVRRVTSEAEVRDVIDLYRVSAAHAGFPLHDDEYYLAIHREMGDASLLVAAFSEGKPCSFVWSVVSGATAFELYGGVDDAGRKLRANAPVKWHATRLAAEAGVRRYDMNGLLNDGISEFKKSFAQHTDELVGTFDVPFGPLFAVWDRALPTAKQVLRKIRR